jgi:DNA-binding response OmpR family regulator
VLILEDDPLIAFDLATTVEANLGAEVIVVGTLAAAKKVNPGNVDVAILDVNIGSATSFDFAPEMLKAGVPVAFASGSHQSGLPADLADVAFLSKPCSRSAVFFRAALTVRRELC